MSAQRKADAEYVGANNNKEKRADINWQSGKWRQNDQDAEEDENAGAGHKKEYIRASQ